MSITTEQAHGNLRNLLINGRILLNGLSLTFNEQSALLQSEQMLFEKATQLDKKASEKDEQKDTGKKDK